MNLLIIFLGNLRPIILKSLSNTEEAKLIIVEQLGVFTPTICPKCSTGTKPLGTSSRI